jgi:hypothetical protein
MARACRLIRLRQTGRGLGSVARPFWSGSDGDGGVRHSGFRPIRESRTRGSGARQLSHSQQAALSACFRMVTIGRRRWLSRGHVPPVWGVRSGTPSEVWSGCRVVSNDVFDEFRPFEQDDRSTGLDRANVLARQLRAAPALSARNLRARARTRQNQHQQPAPGVTQTGAGPCRDRRAEVPWTSALCTAAANGRQLSRHRMEAAGQLARIWCRFSPSPLRVRRVVRTCRPPPSPDTRQPPHRRRRPLGNSSFPWLRKAPPRSASLWTSISV